MSMNCEKSGTLSIKMQICVHVYAFHSDGVIQVHIVTYTVQCMVVLVGNYISIVLCNVMKITQYIMRLMKK